MSEKRLTTWQKATALVPLALLSGAWTTSLAATGTATAAGEDGSQLPDGTSIPNQAIEAPASVSQPGSIAPGVPEGSTASIISSTSTNGIPAAAIAAYQRAEQVINSADPACNLPWELLAAIGRVESDHGRYGGNTLNDEGKSVPGIFGIPLDGSNGTARITDTDAGQYDDDPIYDRAVGPMQFIPSTWSVVGVDGDGDDVRDPQDIDDAALASAVYLCSGEENLATPAGQQTAVYRYNHSDEYVDLVLSIMNAYLNGNFASVPNGVAAPTVFAPMPQDVVVTQATGGQQPRDNNRSKAGAQTGGGSTSTGGSTSGSTGSTGGGGGSDAGGGDGGIVPGPGAQETQAPNPTDTVQDTVDKAKKTVDEVEQNVVDPTAYCSKELESAGLSASGQALQKCVAEYEAGGTGAVNALIKLLTDPLGLG